VGQASSLPPNLRQAGSLPHLLRPGRLFLGGGLALAELDGFADAVAEVIQLGTASDAATLYFQLGNLRRMEWEFALDAFAGDDSPDSEHLAEAAAASGDHRAAEDLDSLVLAFQDAGVDIDRVADIELRRLGGELLLLDQLSAVLLFDELDDVVVHGMKFLPNLNVRFRGRLAVERPIASGGRCPRLAGMWFGVALWRVEQVGPPLARAEVTLLPPPAGDLFVVAV